MQLKESLYQTSMESTYWFLRYFGAGHVIWAVNSPKIEMQAHMIWAISAFILLSFISLNRVTITDDIGEEI